MRPGEEDCCLQLRMKTIVSDTYSCPRLSRLGRSLRPVQTLSGLSLWYPCGASCGSSWNQLRRSILVSYLQNKVRAGEAGEEQLGPWGGA